MKFRFLEIQIKMYTNLLTIVFINNTLMQPKNVYDVVIQIIILFSRATELG
jgi:hypothetical protein